MEKVFFPSCADPEVGTRGLYSLENHKLLYVSLKNTGTDSPQEAVGGPLCEVAGSAHVLHPTAVFVLNILEKET